MPTVKNLMIVRMVVSDFYFNLSFTHSQAPFLVRYLQDLHIK